MNAQTLAPASSPVVLINHFSVKPGRLDEFIAVQTAALEGFRGRVPGWLGSRLHRGLDDNSAVMMSVFDSVDSHARWNRTAEFAAHRARILPLVDRAEPRFYTLAHAAHP